MWAFAGNLFDPLLRGFYICSVMGQCGACLVLVIAIFHFHIRDVDRMTSSAPS